MDILFSLLCKIYSIVRRLIFPRNPQAFEEVYEKKLEKITNRDVEPKDVLKRYKWLERYYWGDARLDDKFHHAWSCILIATCYKEIKKPELASDYFHYAAHTFRNIGEYGKAIKYYEEASDLSCTPEAKKKHLSRAFGAARMCGDLEKERSLSVEIESLSNTGNSAQPHS